jgi:hypothetical protein
MKWQRWGNYITRSVVTCILRQVEKNDQAETDERKDVARMAEKRNA